MLKSYGVNKNTTRKWCQAMSNSLNVKGIKSILFVCMGNMCRSPSAEAVFRHKMQAKRNKLNQVVMNLLDL